MTDAPLPEMGPHYGRRLTFTVRLAVFYAALFLVYGLHVPYFPVWLDSRGLTAPEIAAVTGAPFFIRLVVTPALALLADRSGNHRTMVIALAWVSLVLALVLSQVAGFSPIFLIAVPFALALSTIMPLTETICVTGVRSAGLDYGRMRLWGSLTFIGIGLAGGLAIDRLGAGSMIWLIIATTFLMAVASRLLPIPSGSSSPHETSARGHLVLREASRLVRSPVFLLFLLASGAVQGAHAMFYTFGALHWRSQGISTAMVGTLWAIGVLAEVALFAYSGAVVKRVGAAALLLAGAAGAVLRWGMMGFDPPLVLLAPLQILHALSYSATHLGAIHFISQAVPEGAAGTAQALYATMAAGVVMGFATLASGALYDSFGGGAYFAMCALAAVGLVAALEVYRRWGGGELWDTATPR